MNIVITGAGKGIGFSIVSYLLELRKNNTDFHNIRIIALSRNTDSLTSFQKDNECLTLIQCDFNNQTEMESAINGIINTISTLDILINNAGAIVNKPFQTITSSDLFNLISVNFSSPFLFTQKLIPLLLRSEHSHVLNITSMGSFQGSQKFSGLSAYSATKAALNCLTECLAEEYKNTSIHFNALALGAVNTMMFQIAFPNHNASINPVGISKFIVDFAFNASKLVNGKVFPISLSNP